MKLTEIYTKRGKRVRVVLCVLLACFLLTSCGGNAGTPSSGRASDKPGATSGGSPDKTDAEGSLAEEFTYNGSAPVSKEPKKFSILTTNGASKVYDFENMTWWQEALKRANIQLDMEIVDSSAYADVVQPRLAAAADLPDAILLPNRDPDMSYINSGIFIELSDLYEKYGYNLKKQFERNPGLRSEITTPDGEIYYLPYIYVTVDNSRCLMMNMGYMDALGMKEEDIKDLDDYYDYLVAVKEEDVNGDGDAADEIPLFMRSGTIQLWGMAWGLDLADTGGFQVKDDGKVVCGYADDKYKEMLIYFNKLYQEGLLNSEFSTANLDTQTALFSKNQVGSILHFISNCTGYSQKVDPSWDFEKDELVMQPIEPLTGPYGDQHVYGRDILGSIFGITKSCDDPETLFSFFDYLYGEEAGILTWYGLEGSDYTLDGDKYKFSEQYISNKDNYRTNNGYNFGGLPSYQYPGGYMASQSQKVRDISASLSSYVMNPTITFSYILPEENEIIQAYAADLATYFSENLVAFITGTRSLNEWDAYVKTLDSMHLSDVINVYQAEVDRKAAVK